MKNKGKRGKKRIARKSVKKKPAQQTLLSKKMLAVVIFTMILFGTLGIWVMVTNDNFVQASEPQPAKAVLKFTIEKPYDPYGDYGDGPMVGADEKN